MKKMKLNFKKSKVSIAFLVLIGLFMTSCEKSDPNEELVVATEVSTVSTGLTSKKKPRTTGIVGNGVNLQPSYYNGGNCDLGWTLMKATGHENIKSVRIEVEPGQVTNAKRWIKEAKDNHFQVIVTYHKSAVLGSDNAEELLDAAKWWKKNYATLGGGFVINLMNEWGSHDITASAYATAYNNAIAVVREVYQGSIIIDIPGWGQETATAACAVKGCAPGQTRITDTKIILSAHIYPGAWNQAKGRHMINADLDDLATSGRPCMVGEFGNKGGGSGTNWSAMVTHATNKGWTVIGWAWAGDGVGMNMITPQFQSFVNGSPKTYTKSAHFTTIYNKL
jgi:mannan endo-1,4-beta-mannosidase